MGFGRMVAFMRQGSDIQILSLRLQGSNSLEHYNWTTDGHDKSHKSCKHVLGVCWCIQSLDDQAQFNILTTSYASSDQPSQTAWISLACDRTNSHRWQVTHINRFRTCPDAHRLDAWKHCDSRIAADPHLADNRNSYCPKICGLRLC